MQIENIFPVPLATFEVPQDILDTSLSNAKTYMKNKDWKNQQHYGKSITSYHNDNSRNYLGNFDYLLANYINEESREYLNRLGFNPESDLRIESWLNLNPPNTQHSKHEHYGCFMSGVVWLVAPEKSGNFVIHDPLGVRSQNTTQYAFAQKETTEYNQEVYSVVPEAGKLIMFPSWLPHQVQSNQSEHDRISIAFNIWMTI